MLIKHSGRKRERENTATWVKGITCKLLARWLRSESESH